MKNKTYINNVTRVHIQTVRGVLRFAETGKKVPLEWMDKYKLCMDTKKGWIRVPNEVLNSYLSGW